MIKNDATVIICDHCDRTEIIENSDTIPRGWFLLYAFNNDDGNVYPARDACSERCVGFLALRAEQDLKE